MKDAKWQKQTTNGLSAVEEITHRFVKEVKNSDDEAANDEDERKS